MTHPTAKYYVLIFSLYHGVLAIESEDIMAIIAGIRAAKQLEFLYLVSANATDKILEMQQEARRRMN